MRKSLALEDFAQPPDISASLPVEERPVAGSEDVDSLQAYESGYKNGWSDCAVAEAEERKSVGAQLAERIREAELTYETARCDVLDALAPFFDDLVATLLPRLTAEAIAPNVSQELRNLLDQQVSGVVEILAAPASCESLQKLLDAEGLDTVSVRAEPAFAESQVSLRVGTERRDIDLSEVSERIASAIRALQSQIDEPTNMQGAA